MELNEKSSNWNGGDQPESTVDPSISVSIIEEVPTLTVATIAAVTVVVLIAIAAVFLLGVLLDCRQQRLLEKKMGEVKKVKNHRRNMIHINNDVVSIVNEMEEPGSSVAPAEMLRHTP